MNLKPCTTSGHRARRNWFGVEKVLRSIDKTAYHQQRKLIVSTSPTQSQSIQEKEADERQNLRIAHRFVLPEMQWAAFNAALDAPPKAVPALKKLLKKASVFERVDARI